MTTTDHIEHTSVGAAWCGLTDPYLRFREVLVRWLRWNEVYEHVSARMFDERSDSQQLERMMDQMDNLRRQTIALSHAVLD